MKPKKSVLKDIQATVMPQTLNGLHKMMGENQLTMGEVIDRLVLQMTPHDSEDAVNLAMDEIIICFSELTEEQYQDAYMKLFLSFASMCRVDSLQGLEQKAIARRAEAMEHMKQRIADMSEEDRAALLEEVALLKKREMEQKQKSSTIE